MQRIEKEREIFGLDDFEKTDEGFKADELDLLPEYCRYRDEGCRLAPSCLECPFPSCIEEQFRGCLKKAKKLRDEEIWRQYTIEQISSAELCTRFNLNPRSMRRILARGRKQNE
jgi:hypothetical protein